MAKIFPTLENIERLKVKPTEGEFCLIKYLIKNLSDSIEIYFQPFLNGDMPDIILMQKNVGVSIIEVKDWNLDLYKIDQNNKWYLKKNNALLKSPFQQVYHYKDNMFNIHINGLLQKKIINAKFYGRINVFVYFYKATNNLSQFFNSALLYWKTIENDCHNDFKNKKVTYEQYSKKLNYINNKSKKIKRDSDHAINNQQLDKIKLPDNQNNHLFTDNIYEEFKRLLQPPSHVKEDGIEIKYTVEQNKLIVSKNIHEKIMGVAGSGKTVVLAKRAVNGHKRHKEKVLILTYNITLKRYIHDKISDIRENFRWDAFYINNYHGLMLQLFNNLNIKFNIPDDIQQQINQIENAHDRDKYKEEYLENKYFSNTRLFQEHSGCIDKYKTILIDEIQDYKPSWIKILRDFFCYEDSEIVLFGDEKQNIYERDYEEEINTRIPVILQGFGKWKRLNKSIRFSMWNSSLILPLAQNFQIEFFKNKYEIDKQEKSKMKQPSLIDDVDQMLFQMEYYQKEDYEKIVYSIINEIKNRNIHNDDIVILASKIQILKEVDYVLRNKYKIKTITTFETKEMEEKFNHEVPNIRKFKKIAFNHHSGKLKISTIHSFKGYESHTVFLIIDENNKCSEHDDNPEIVYTGITRSKLNLMVFLLENSIYDNFFRNTFRN